MCFTGIICHVAFKFAKSTKEVSETNVSTVPPPSNANSRGFAVGGAAGSSSLPDKDLFLQDEESETPLLISKDDKLRESDEENDLWER